MEAAAGKTEIRFAAVFEVAQVGNLRPSVRSPTVREGKTRDHSSCWYTQVALANARASDTLIRKLTTCATNNDCASKKILSADGSQVRR